MTTDIGTATSKQVSHGHLHLGNRRINMANPEPPARWAVASGWSRDNRTGVAGRRGPGKRADPDLVGGAQPQPAGRRQCSQRGVLCLSECVHGHGRPREQRRCAGDPGRALGWHPLVAGAQPQRGQGRQSARRRVLCLGGRLHGGGLHPGRPLADPGRALDGIRWSVVPTPSLGAPAAT